VVWRDAFSAESWRLIIGLMIQGFSIKFLKYALALGRPALTSVDLLLRVSDERVRRLGGGPWRYTGVELIEL
jgi:hypothetical protein